MMCRRLCKYEYEYEYDDDTMGDVKSVSIPGAVNLDGYLRESVFTDTR